MAFIVELEHIAPEVISLTTARKQLQLEADFTEDDALIEIYIEAAIIDAENYINLEITEKKFRIDGKSFEDVLKFNKQKITSIDSILYKDVTGVEQTIDPENYHLDSVDKYENKITFKEDFVLPEVKEYTPNAVKISVTVGYPSGKVPKAIVKNLLLMITNSYEFRTDTVKEKITASETSLHKYRRY